MKKKYKSTPFIPSRTIESNNKVNPNATLSPDADLYERSGETINIYDKEATTALPEEETKKEKNFLDEDYHTMSPAGFLERHLPSWVSIPFLLPIIVFIFIVIQDNGAGFLLEWENVIWSFKKAISILSIIYFLLFLNWSFNKIFVKNDKKSNNL